MFTANWNPWRLLKRNVVNLNAAGEDLNLNTVPPADRQGQAFDFLKTAAAWDLHLSLIHI